MPIVKNIVNLPPTSVADGPLIDLAPPSARRGINVPGTISGKVSNGHISVFASAANQGNNQATISFKISVEGIDTINYKRWQLLLHKILGKKALDKIHDDLHQRITNVFGPQPQLNDDHLLAYYSLEVMSYIYPDGAGNDLKYLNQNDQPFSSAQCSGLKCKRVLASILSLPKTQINMKGELTVSTADPVQNAFIPITYFDFNRTGNLPGNLIPFVGFPGSIVLLTRSNQEIVSKPGILKVTNG